MKLGEVIREYRMRENLSMGDFANETGLSKTYISMLERNYNTSTGKEIIPSIATLSACAKAMHCTLDDLIDLLDDDQLVNVCFTTEAGTVQRNSHDATASVLLRAQEELPPEKLAKLEEIASLYLNEFGKKKR